VGASVRGAELWVLGAHAADVAAGAAGQGTTARRFASMSDVQTALREALAPGVVVLLKASRGVALERVLDGLEGD
jgi:UDP-N-acetylmuramyl pentapeptide synthase